MEARDEEEHVTAQSPQVYEQIEDPFRLAKGDACRNETKEGLDLVCNKPKDADMTPKSEINSRFDDWYHSTDSIPNSPLESDFENPIPGRFLSGDVGDHELEANHISESYMATHFGTESLSGTIHDFLSNDVFLNVAALSSAEGTPENLNPLDENSSETGSVNPLLEDVNIAYVTNMQEKFCRGSPRITRVDSESESNSVRGDVETAFEKQRDDVPFLPLGSYSVMNIADFVNSSDHLVDSFIENEDVNSISELNGQLEANEYETPDLTSIEKDYHETLDDDHKNSNVNDIHSEVNPVSAVPEAQFPSTVSVEQAISLKFFENSNVRLTDVDMQSPEIAFEMEHPSPEGALFERIADSNCNMESLEDLIEAEIATMKNILMYNEVLSPEHNVPIDAAINPSICSSEIITTEFLTREHESYAPDGAIFAVVNDLLHQLEDRDIDIKQEIEEPFVLKTSDIHNDNAEDKEEILPSTIITNPYDVHELSDFVYGFPSYPVISAAADMTSSSMIFDEITNSPSYIEEMDLQIDCDTPVLQQPGTANLMEDPDMALTHEMCNIEPEEIVLDESADQFNLSTAVHSKLTIENYSGQGTECATMDTKIETEDEPEAVKSRETDKCSERGDELSKTLSAFLADHVFQDAVERSLVSFAEINEINKSSPLSDENNDKPLYGDNDSVADSTDAAISKGYPDEVYESCIDKDMQSNCVEPSLIQLEKVVDDVYTDASISADPLVDNEISFHEDIANKNGSKFPLSLEEKMEANSTTQLNLSQGYTLERCLEILDRDGVENKDVPNESLLFYQRENCHSNQVESDILVKPDEEQDKNEAVKVSEKSETVIKRLPEDATLKQSDDGNLNYFNGEDSENCKLSCNNLATQLNVSDDEMAERGHAKNEQMVGEDFPKNNIQLNDNETIINATSDYSFRISMVPPLEVATTDQFNGDNKTHDNTLLINSPANGITSLEEYNPTDNSADIVMEISPEISYPTDSQESSKVANKDVSHEEDLVGSEVQMIHDSTSFNDNPEPILLDCSWDQDRQLLNNADLDSELLAVPKAPHSDSLLVAPEEKSADKIQIGNERSEEFETPELTENDDIESLETEEVNTSIQDIATENHFVDVSVSYSDQVPPVYTIASTILEGASVHYSDPEETLSGKNFTCTKIKSFHKLSPPNVQKSGSLTELVKDSQIMSPTSKSQCPKTGTTAMDFTPSETDNNNIENYTNKVDDGQLSDSDLENDYQKLLQIDKPANDSSSLSSASTSVTPVESKSNLDIVLKESYQLKKDSNFDEIELNENTTMKPNSQKAGILSRIRNWLYYITSVFRRPRRI